MHKHVRSLLDHCQLVFRSVSDWYQIGIKSVSDHCQIGVRSLSDYFQIGTCLHMYANLVLLVIGYGLCSTKCCWRAAMP